MTRFGAFKRLATLSYAFRRTVIRNCTLERLPADTDHPSARGSQRLGQWLRENGMENDGASIGQSGVSDRGLFSTMDFVKGDPP